MLMFDRFRLDYDDTDFVPKLSDEWLTPIEVATCQRQEQARRQEVVSQDGPAPQKALADDAPPQSAPFQRTPDSSSQRAPAQQRALDPPPPLDEPVNPPFVDAFMDAPPNESPVAPLW